MNYHRLIPLFGNKSETKFYLNKKFLGNQSLKNDDWEQYGFNVKQYHLQNNNDLSKHLHILKYDLTPFEKKIIKNNFKIFKGSTEITNKYKLWKEATKIVPFQMFHTDKYIYQGYNKTKLHKKINLNNLALNDMNGGSYNIKDIENFTASQASNFWTTSFKAFSALSPQVQDDFKKIYREYLIDLRDLLSVITKIDEYYELIKYNDNNSKKIQIFDSNNNFILDNEIIKEKKLQEKINSHQKTLGLFFQKFGIKDLSKYGIFI